MDSSNIRVTEAEIQEAMSQVDPELLTVMKRAMKIFGNITKNRSSTAGLIPVQTELFWDRR